MNLKGEGTEEKRRRREENGKRKRKGTSKMSLSFIPSLQK